MILPPGHAQRVAQYERRSFTRRERYLIGGVLSVLAVLVVATAIALTTGERTSANGCISVSLAYSMGGTMDHHCGAAARRMCAQVGRPGLTGAAGQDTAAACRKAGLPVG